MTPHGARLPLDTLGDYIMQARVRSATIRAQSKTINPPIMGARRMAENRKLVFEIDCPEDVTLPDLKIWLDKTLAAIPPEFHANTKFEMEDAEDGYRFLKVTWWRYETDAELAARLEEAARQRRRYVADKEFEERQQLARLKAKYEK